MSTPKTIAAAEWDHFEDGDVEFDDDNGMDECGLTRDGQCTMAGSEHCDFCCPNRNSEHFAGSRAWCRKHGEPYE